MLNMKTALVIAMMVVFSSAELRAEVFLPGTQPEEHNIRMSKVGLCRSCHGKTSNGNSDPFFSWQGGMMAQAARDPVYLAALAIANQDVPGVGEYCIRCHAPAGWLEGRSKTADGSGLTKEDKNGVSCDVCHRFVDPLSDEAKGMAKDIPPGYGNGMFLVDPNKVARGPYDDSPPVKSHKAMKSPFHGSGNLCGTCHDVSNPLAATDIKKQRPYEYGIIERTYSEWALSSYASGEGAQSCQSCHYPAIKGGGKAARQASAKHRDHFVEHGPVGGSTWVQSAVASLFKDDKRSQAPLEFAKKKAMALLRTSARLDLTSEGKNKGSLKITNLTGHKLPTGYPEGRRMWINIDFRAEDGTSLHEIGRYGKIEAVAAGRTVKVPTLIEPEGTRVYQSLPGISKGAAEKHGKPAGKSFHFVLNDEVTFDNRIPPKGFSNSAFTEHGCQPVGVSYADGQHWDDYEFEIPAGTVKVKARLMYQSVSWEYVKFLLEENRTNDAGKVLFSVWNRTGQCPPTVIAEADLAL